MVEVEEGGERRGGSREVEGKINYWLLSSKLLNGRNAFIGVNLRLKLLLYPQLQPSPPGVENPWLIA
jgi:hypothetical protein